MNKTVKDNVIATCYDHNLPAEFAVYFLTMIDIAGGDYNAPTVDSNVFMDTIRRISVELGVPMTADPVPTDTAH